MLTGACYCGAIRYQIKAEPINRTVCHCSICRGTTGTPCVAWFTVARAAFHLQGTPTLYRSSARGTRAFCSICGTQLTFTNLQFPDDIDVSTCSLRDPAAVAPTSHIFTSSQLSWLHVSDDLPRFSGSRLDQDK